VGVFFIERRLTSADLHILLLLIFFQFTFSTFYCLGIEYKYFDKNCTGE